MWNLQSTPVWNLAVVLQVRVAARPNPGGQILPRESESFTRAWRECTSPHLDMQHVSYAPDAPASCGVAEITGQGTDPPGHGIVRALCGAALMASIVC